MYFLRSKCRQGWAVTGGKFWRSIDWQVIWTIVQRADYVLVVLVKTFNFSGSLCVSIYATGLQHSSSAFICFASISTFNQRKLITAIILGSTTDEKSHSHSQLLFYTADSELADWLTKAFTYLLPLGG